MFSIKKKLFFFNTSIGYFFQNMNGKVEFSETNGLLVNPREEKII